MLKNKRTVMEKYIKGQKGVVNEQEEHGQQ